MTLKYVCGTTRCVYREYESKFVVFVNSFEVVTFGIPLIIIIHNYTRVSYTLVKSLKQNLKLTEGNKQE